MPRYRFGDFVLSPRRRVLVRNGREQPLIPRYFDLLVFLVARRHEAVHRRDIFDGVWTDVIVSDSALSQAIRTIRRTLGDDPREPRFIRTVSRHGYRFVCAEVVEEEDDGAWANAAPAAAPAGQTADGSWNADPFDGLIERIARAPSSAADEEEQIEAAEQLHALGTDEAVRRLGSRPGHARARALLRAARWDVPGAGDVPLAGIASAVALARLRIRLSRAARAPAGGPAPRSAPPARASSRAPSAACCSPSRPAAPRPPTSSSSSPRSAG